VLSKKYHPNIVYETSGQDVFLNKTKAVPDTGTAFEKNNFIFQQAK